MKYALIVVLFFSSFLHAYNEKNSTINSKMINKIKKEISEGKFDKNNTKSVLIKKGDINSNNMKKITESLKTEEDLSTKDINKIIKKIKDDLKKDKERKINLLIKKYEISSNKKIKDKDSAKSLIITNKTRARLPEPYKSIMIGRYVAVFAYYKEPQMKDSANPVEFEVKVNKDNAESRRLIDEMNAPIREPGLRAERIITNDQRRSSKLTKDDSLNFITKDIRLYIGSQFNGWKVKRLTTHFVVFENILDKRTVKKYY